MVRAMNPWSLGLLEGPRLVAERKSDFIYFDNLVCGSSKHSYTLCLVVTAFTSHLPKLIEPPVHAQLDWSLEIPPFAMLHDCTLLHAFAGDRMDWQLSRGSAWPHAQVSVGHFREDT